ncbi:hypothetical protein [Brachyspira alvinipulli]|uniref:hypothetical protein n=1 Tax=Brachyspira alvinipulli TaxID=84379 RepID=UPI00048A3CD5|nr:hypothetical protein [Brachyspira alvinipulli]
MIVVHAGDIVNLSIAHYDIAVKTGSSCEIIPTISKYPIENKTVSDLGVRNFPVSDIVTAGFNNLEVVLTPKTERILQLILDYKMTVHVILEIAGDLAYMGDLYMVGGLQTDAMERTAKISMAGDSFILMEKKNTLLDKINQAVNKYF